VPIKKSFLRIRLTSGNVCFAFQFSSNICSTSRHCADRPPASSRGSDEGKNLYCYFFITNRIALSTSSPSTLLSLQIIPRRLSRNGKKNRPKSRDGGAEIFIRCHSHGGRSFQQCTRLSSHSREHGTGSFKQPAEASIFHLLPRFSLLFNELLFC
jgi:hypothetical protein